MSSWNPEISIEKFLKRYPELKRLLPFLCMDCGSEMTPIPYISRVRIGFEGRCPCMEEGHRACTGIVRGDLEAAALTFLSAASDEV